MSVILTARPSLTRGLPLLRIVTTTQPRRSIGEAKKPVMPLPTPPPEKKWFYREVWSALRPKVDDLKQETAPKQLEAKSSSSSSSWVPKKLTAMRDQSSELVERYGLRERFENMFNHYCRVVIAVKEFFYQKRYREMGSIVDGGLKSLEERIKRLREERGKAPELKKGRDVVVKLHPKCQGKKQA